RDPALADRYLARSLGSYGPKTGMPRILDLLDRYDLKTCIFIPGWIVERYPALCEEIVKRGHEVGQHGYLHERPSSLKSRDEEEALLVKSLDIFKKVLGVTPPRSRSPPRLPHPAPHGAAQKARLRLPHQRPRPGPAVLHRDLAGPARGVPHLLVQQ